MKNFTIFALLSLFLANPSYARSLKVMSYNVENLFDTEHDAGKDDWTFVPLSHPDKVKNCEKVEVEYYKKTCLETDWTPDKLEIKISQIEKVVKGQGVLPDILGLLEVENSNVIRMLQKKLGYKKFIITNSPDQRGVDVALLFNPSSNLTFVSSKEHQLKTSRTGIFSPTRNILEVNFVVSGQPLSIYINHWPSQQSGPSSRQSAASQVLDIIKSKLSMPTAKILLMGDFNVTDSERPNPMSDILLNQTGLTDVYSNLTNAQKSKLPPGTYFYGWDFSWNRLDRIICSVSPNGVQFIT
ncbi:MAG: endonuclease/exonuclease/phosphatase family protein [Bacteriovoracaceae bacterium]